MNEIIENLKDEVKWTKQYLFIEIQKLSEIRRQIAEGNTDVIPPSAQQALISKLEGKISGLERAIDLINLELIEQGK